VSVLGGFDYHYYISNFTVGVQALVDVRGVHDGSELRFAVSHDKTFERARLSTALGFIWQDAKSIDYYYGLNRDEVESSALIYEAGSGLSPFARLDFNYKLNDRWSLKAAAYYRKLANSISDSPIVEESSYTTVFFGGVYHF
jgi:outer membrane protein